MLKKISLLLLTSLLSSCATTRSVVKAEGEQEPTYEFSFNEYNNVRIHTDLQYNYLNDEYQNVNNYASGTSELSRPLTFTLDWDFITNSGETINDYYLNVTSDETLSSFETYKCSNSEYTFTNLIIGTTYYYFVTANTNVSSYSSDIHTFKTEDKGPRNVYVDGITNVRDLGGYVTASNKRVKQGMVYRTGQLNNGYSLTVSPKITLEGRKMLLDVFKIKSEIDLREIYNNENGALYDSVLGKDVNYYPYHMGWDVVNIAKNETESMRNVFKVFTNRNNYPVIFHCAIGTDRTGVVAFYLNALLGLNNVDIYRDYLFSNFGNIGGPRGLDHINSHFTYLSTFEGNTLQEKAYSYFESIGFTKQELDNICNIMLEPNI